MRWMGKDALGMGDPSIYACPACKGALKVRDEGLNCEACHTNYPIVSGIPDFILEDLTQSAHPVLRGVKSIDRDRAGFESFQPQVRGSILLFSARKRKSIAD